MKMMNKDKTAAAVAAIIYCLLGMAVNSASAAASIPAVSNAESMMLVGVAMPVCNGSIGECLAADQEFLMESEISRRFLQDGKSITYPALNPDRPVCSPGKGKSYGGNCLPPRSNPPSRGCNGFYDRCRTGGG